MGHQAPNEAVKLTVLHLTYLKNPRGRRGVADPVAISEPIRVGHKGLVSGSRTEPDDMHLGSRIHAAHPPLDRAAVPAQQAQYGVLIPLSGHGVPWRHLDNGDQKQFSGQIVPPPCRHRPKYPRRRERVSVLSVRAEHTGGVMAVIEETIPPGALLTPHTHHNDVWVHVLTGQIGVLVGTESGSTPTPRGCGSCGNATGSESG